MCVQLIWATLVWPVQAEDSARDKAGPVPDSHRTEDLLADYQRAVKSLQAQGDPLGDYLWAKANEDKKVDAPIDPAQIKKMVADAAARGSIDAQLLLAVRHFQEVATPINIAKVHVTRFFNGQDLSKDQELADTWKKKAQLCEADPAYQEALSRCRPSVSLERADIAEPISVW